MKKKKIIDPETGKEIWVLVDEAGNIIEKNVSAPEDVLTEAQKKELELEKQKDEKEKLEVFQQTTLTEVESLKSTIATMSESMAKMMQFLAEGKLPTVKPEEGTQVAGEAQAQEKVVYVADPQTEQQNKILAQKVKEFDEYKALQANKEFISAQINAKPFMKELIAQLGIKTQADYIRIAMPLEEREEENAKLREQIKNNQNRNPINEYGMGMYGISSSSETVIDKANKDAQVEAESFLSRLLT